MILGFPCMFQGHGGMFCFADINTQLGRPMLALAGKSGWQRNGLDDLNIEDVAFRESLKGISWYIIIPFQEDGHEISTDVTNVDSQWTNMCFFQIFFKFLKDKWHPYPCFGSSNDFKNPFEVCTFLLVPSLKSNMACWISPSIETMKTQHWKTHGENHG